MKRRHGVSRLYSRLRFRCPRGHVIAGAEVMRTDAGGDPDRAEYWTGDLERVEGPDGATKLRMRCPKCLAVGRGSDLQVSWDRRIRPRLDELHADATRGEAFFDL